MSETEHSPICPNCIYSLSGLDSEHNSKHRCPECGQLVSATTQYKMKLNRSENQVNGCKLFFLLLFFLALPLIAWIALMIFKLIVGTLMR